MRALIAAAALTCACAAPHPAAAPGAAVPAAPTPALRPSRPLFPQAAVVTDPNFVLTVTEVVADPTQDGPSYTKVFVDGVEVGRTDVGLKSQTRTLALKLPAGNRPVRLEQWILPATGDWTRLDDDRQPRERFVRILPGTVARLELRFSDGEESNTLSLSRSPASGK